jgi:hypothetical protein
VLVSVKLILEENMRTFKLPFRKRVSKAWAVVDRLGRILEWDGAQIFRTNATANAARRRWHKGGVVDCRVVAVVIRYEA